MSRFHIMYWYGPTAKETTLERYREIQNAGFTMISPPGLDAEEMKSSKAVDINRKILSIGKKLNLPVMLADQRIYDAVTSKGDWKTGLQQVVADYARNSALDSYFVTDEPHSRLFPRLGEIVAELKRLDPKRQACINLFPTYASAEQLGSKDFREHLEDYIRLVKPSFVSYDHYHWLLDSQAPQPPADLSGRDKEIWENAWDRKGSGVDRPGYLENLQITWEVCRKHRLPMMVVALLLPHGPYRDPSVSEMLWDSYQALAYGVKRLCWFTYWTPGMDEWNFHNGCITADGKRTHNYDEITEVNKEVLPIGKALVNLSSMDVLHVGDETEKVTPFRPNAIIRDVKGGRFTVGLFVRGRVLVANKDYKQTAVCQMKLGQGITPRLFDRTTGVHNVMPVQDGWINISIKPGGAELIILR